MIASSGNQIGIAYFRTVNEPDQPLIQCPPTFGGSGGGDRRPAQNMHYVHFDGSSWGTPVMIAQTIGTSHGLSVVLDSSGNPYVGYLGDNGTYAKQECSSSDAYIAASSDKGQTWTRTMIFDSGPVGDTTGQWAAIALDPSGNPQLAYRDVGFGIEINAAVMADLRFGPSGEDVLVDRGDGLYNLMRYTAAGEPAILTYNGIQQGAEGGLKVAVKRNNTWEISSVTSSATSERPGFATNGTVWGVAYYNDSLKALRYVESSDLKAWGQGAIVDTTGSTHGEFASLAYDSNGNPGISYYRCGDLTCAANKDALMFAYRRGSSWQTVEVDTGGSNLCGRYTALAFNEKNEPVIAYECVVIDNSTNMFISSLKVARGTWN